MWLFNKFKKKSIFCFDKAERQYKAEINGITFHCSRVRKEYEQYAVDLANNYEEKLPDIIKYMLPDIQCFFEVSDVEVIKKSLGKATIELDYNDRSCSTDGCLVYCEHTLDDTHLIEIDFDGIFENFFCVNIDG